jgi:hypothetical protein
MTYHAIVENEQGQIAEVLVTRENGRQLSQVETGRTFATMREASRELQRQNCR